MKSLSESLFDTNVISKDVVLGDVFEFDTPTWFLNAWKKSDIMLASFFSTKAINSLENEDKWDIERNNSEYMGILKRVSYRDVGDYGDYKLVVMLINLLLDMPASIIYSGKSSSFIRDDVKKYLLKYCKPSAKTGLRVWSNLRIPGNDNVDREELDFIIGREHNSNGEIKLKFKKK